MTVVELPPPGHRLEPQLPRDLVRNVVLNQMLWTAGYSLMGGGAIAYFAKDLGASGFQLSLILTAPELLGLASLSAGPLSQVWGSFKSLWLTATLVSRACLVALPVIAYGHSTASIPMGLEIVIVCYALAALIQAIAYTGLMSWLSQLAPSPTWGRFFAAQELGALFIKIVFLWGGGVLHQMISEGPSRSLLSYAVLFGAGIVLTSASVIPLLFLPFKQQPPTFSPPESTPICSNSLYSQIVVAIQSIWPLLVCHCWLAAFQGLTQAVFYQYQTKVLGITLLTNNLLLAWLYVVQFLLAYWIGSQLDRRCAKPILILGLIVVSMSLPCWLAAERFGILMLVCAFTLWGGFAVVNLSFKTLLLRLLPPQKATGIACFYHLAGLLAGLSGLLGGYLLDQMLTHQLPLMFSIEPRYSYHLLIAISWIGRLTAPLWLFFLVEPPKVSESLIVGFNKSESHHSSGVDLPS